MHHSGTGGHVKLALKQLELLDNGRDIINKQPELVMHFLTVVVEFVLTLCLQRTWSRS